MDVFHTPRRCSMWLRTWSCRQQTPMGMRRAIPLPPCLVHQSHGTHTHPWELWSSEDSPEDDACDAWKVAINACSQLVAARLLSWLAVIPWIGFAALAYVDTQVPLYSSLPLLQSELDGPGISIVLCLKPRPPSSSADAPQMQPPGARQIRAAPAAAPPVSGAGVGAQGSLGGLASGCALGALRAVAGGQWRGTGWCGC